jgi:hypothetical protein
MINSRLDYISSFADGAVEKMSEMRQKFIDLDNDLKNLADAANSTYVDSMALFRSIDLCRTHIEQASMYAIKSICLKYEKGN